MYKKLKLHFYRKINGSTQFYRTNILKNGDFKVSLASENRKLMETFARKNITKLLWRKLPNYSGTDSKKAHLVVKFAFQMILHKKVGNKNEADIWFPLGSCKQAYGEKMWC